MNNFDTGYLDEHKELLDRTFKLLLDKNTDEDYSGLYEAMRYTLCDGGKRVRPFLVLEAYKACTGSDDVMPAVYYAAAVEMIHNSSLIHDDLPAMDDDDIRRGRPSNHMVYGEANAILAGDGLLVLAFETVCMNNYCSSNQNIRAVKTLAECSGTEGMMAGQYIDLSSEGKKISPDTLKKLHLLKTASLLSGSCILGGIAANADKELIDRLELYGKNIGLAFQIKDDIIDLEGDEALAGKTLRKDNASKKATYPSLYGLDQSKYISRKLTDEAIEAVKLLPNKKSAGILTEFAKYLLERKA